MFGDSVSYGGKYFILKIIFENFIQKDDIDFSVQQMHRNITELN